MTSVSIGVASRESGIKVTTIRYYEKIGLIPRSLRTNGNQRFYSKADLQRLAFIKHARELGFSLEAIRSLLGLQDNPDQSCELADKIAQTHLADINDRINCLKLLEAELRRMVKECSHGKIANCRVIEVLGDHELCEHHPSGVANGLSHFPAEKTPKHTHDD